MISWKRTFGIHICCSFLVLAFLVAVPIVTATVGGQAEAEGLAGSCAQKDPLDRLPSSPEEAQERLAEREIGWPDDAAGTGFEAAAVRPDVRVALPYDSVEGFITHASANVKIEVVGKGEKTVAADASGWFKADMSTVCDIVSGDVVKVTDMADASTATINCTLTANIDFGNNRVSGVTNGNANVDVYIVAPSTYYADLPPGAAHKRTVALAGGGFAATFAELDLRRGDIAFVFSKDANGNKVMDVASGSGAGLVVYPQYDDVMGDYIPGTALAVKADAETINVTAMKDGFFEAWFQDYDIIDGTNVACNMGGSRSIVVRDVSANCDPATNRVDGTGPANRPMRVTMDPYGAPVVYNATSDAAGAFAVDLGAAYTASGTDVYNVTWYDDDGDCVVYEFQTFSWYLAEGCTAGGFDTWVLVQNPNDEPANVVLTFMTDQGEVAGPTKTLAPNSRFSWNLGEFVTTYDISTMVTSTTGAWIIAERAVYFTYSGAIPGGHDSIGVITPADTWYLAEGCTAGGFDTWVLVQNPNDEPANVVLTFMTDQGEVAGPTKTLAPNSRFSWNLGEFVTTYDISTMVTSDKPVVAERAVYFTYSGAIPGGHDSIGVITPADTWYLAEGCTAGGFDTWVLVQNPNDEPANVVLTFMTDQGEVAGPTKTLAPNSRFSWNLGEFVTTYDISTMVTSDKPVVAERAVYFTYSGAIPGGHDSIGVITPADTWYLAEGCTAGGFDTWVLVQNPNDEPANVVLTFMTDQGEVAGPTKTLAPNSRFSWNLGEFVTTYDISTMVTSDKPVVAERAMYFTYSGAIPGGHDSVGVPNMLGW